MRIGLTANLKSATTANASPPDAAGGYLLAGESEEEFDQPETLEAIRRVLEGAGHEVVILEPDAGILARIREKRVEVVFNLAEGRSGRSREAHIPALLELAGVPYTGSDPLTLALTLDKPMAKRVCRGAGLPTADFEVFRPEDLASQERFAAKAGALAYPVFVKPAWEGSSKGIRACSRITSGDALREQLERVMASFKDQPVLVEPYLAGREFTIGVLGNAPSTILGVMETKASDGRRDFVYSLEMKRDWEELVTYECPPKNLDASVRRRLEAHALALYEVFGCRDFTRFDFRLDEAGQDYFLEANPLPSINPKSGDFVIMARLQGWTYEQVILGIFEAACERLFGRGSRERARV